MEKTITVSMYIRWYGRNDDFTPNYEDEHHGNIHGKTPQDCMRQLHELQENHDLTRYTPHEIVFIY